MQASGVKVASKEQQPWSSAPSVWDQSSQWRSSKLQCLEVADSHGASGLGFS